jgi:hypothetical protein
VAKIFAAGDLSTPEGHLLLTKLPEYDILEMPIPKMQQKWN